MASIAFNTRITLDDVYIEGIEKLTLRDIEYADELGYVVKLLAIAKNSKTNGISVRVHPTMLPKIHPLSTVNDVYNAIYVNGDVVGDAMFLGRGAGRMKIQFEDFPVFPPEIFARVQPKDSMKRKQFEKGITQLAQEGAIQVFKEKGMQLALIMARIEY